MDDADIIKWGSDTQLGKPSLPVKSMHLVMPQGMRAYSVTVTGTSEEIIEGSFFNKTSAT